MMAAACAVGGIAGAYLAEHDVSCLNLRNMSN